MALFDTFAMQIPLAAADILDEGTTASGSSQYTVKGSDESWDLFVRPGDVIYLGGDVDDIAIITEVVDSDTLKINKPIAAESVSFRIVRPTEAPIRFPKGWEPEIHSIVVSPRMDAGADESLHKYPVEIWVTDDMTPKTLLLTTQNYAEESPPNHYVFKLRELWVTIKPTHRTWLLIRNCQPVRVEVFLNGIDKTVKREES